jgi:hypothetical protein
MADRILTDEEILNLLQERNPFPQVMTKEELYSIIDFAIHLIAKAQDSKTASLVRQETARDLIKDIEKMFPFLLRVGYDVTWQEVKNKFGVE